MNKKHGLVATAWMLGGGLLLNASLVQAQTEMPADEFYAPQRSAPFTPRKTPRLLPKAIRNADASQDGSIVRPILPSDPQSATRKMLGASPAPKRITNRVAITATNYQNETTFQPANQAETPASSVQKQLEEMYRKDGRPMPQMNFHQTPVPGGGQNPNPGNSANGEASHTVPAKPRSLLSKLNPFSRAKTAPAPLPVHPANPMPNSAVRLPQLPSASAGGANTINPAGGNRLNGFNGAAPQAIPNAASAIPAPQLGVGQSGIQNGNQLPNSLPPVPGDPGYQTPTTKSVEAILPAPGSVDDAVENAFKDTTEAKNDIESAPSTPPEPKADEAKATEEGNPFSGLSLDDEFGPAPSSTPAKSTSDEPNAESKTKTAEREIPVPPEAQPAAPPQDEVDAKMKLITERVELRGLKGFCPVALRDDRDLKNAMPEHHSTFKGRTYYFGTAAAKSAFDEHPEHYAPISGGQDVVLLKDKVTKEGSLDQAVWFKDRLYLFTSQKTLEQFVATPKEFAISE